VLAQSPLFFALFRVLYNLGNIASQNGQFRYASIGPINQSVAKEIESATLWGAPLSSTFMKASDPIASAGASPLTIRVVTIVLILLMSVTSFTTQRQLTMKNMPQSAQDNPMFRTQKIMLYMMPAIFAISGVNFPIGVLIYWLTTNLWSMGQQFIVIRKMPAPGSEAERKMREREAKKGRGKGGEDSAEGTVIVEEPPAPRQRVQPKKTTRSQRRSGPQQAANPSPSASGPRKEIEPQDKQSGVVPAPDKNSSKGSGGGGTQKPKPGNGQGKKRKK
jgi:YidC/Oxa1 family membrane protein insertase